MSTLTCPFCGAENIDCGSVYYDGWHRSEKCYDAELEPLRETNKLLMRDRDEARKHLEAIFEDGTEEHNAAVELRQLLAKSRLETDKWKDCATKLYHCLINAITGTLANSEKEAIKLFEELVKTKN